MKRIIAVLISAVMVLGSSVSAFAGSLEEPQPSFDVNCILEDLAGNIDSWQGEIDAITEFSAPSSTEEGYEDFDCSIDVLSETEMEASSIEARDRITWQALLNAYPYIPVQTLNFPYVTKGVPWIAVYAFVARRYPDVVCAAFDQSGKAISYEEAVHVTIETGQHMAFQKNGVCFELDTIGPFLPPTDSDLNPPTYDFDWNMICNAFPNYKVEVIDFDQDPLYRFVGASWIALYYYYLALNDVVLVPFDSAGNVITPEAQKSVLIEKGQHFCVFDESMRLKQLCTVGPVPPPTNSITIADLVTLAKALNGQITLTEAQKEKYGVTGVAPTISDLVRLAKQLNS